MTDWQQRMQTALIDAAAQFLTYSDHHLAKDPPDRDKAAVNLEWSARCIEAAKEPDRTT